jgi:hypothetical protein
MKKTKELKYKNGDIVHVKCRGMLVDMLVLGAKRSYGRNRYLITPVKGKGEAWVEKLTD